MSYYTISCHIHSIIHSFKHVSGTSIFARHYTTPCRTEEERNSPRGQKTCGEQVMRLQYDLVFLSIVGLLT